MPSKYDAKLSKQLENKEQYLYFQLFDYQHLHFLQVQFLLLSICTVY